MPADLPATPKLALSRDEAAEATGLGTRTIDRLIADRSSGFPFARVGGRIVIPVRELAEWLAQRIERPS